MTKLKMMLISLLAFNIIQKKRENDMKKRILASVCFSLALGITACSTPSKKTDVTTAVATEIETSTDTTTEATKTTETTKATKATKAKETSKELADIETSVSEDRNIPTEYKSALNKANSYAKSMHMSKAGIYDQLISEYGEKFSVEAGQYAIDNMVADWNANALKKAESYSQSMHMSRQGVYDQLISDYGEKFTKDEAQYAIDNIKADWNANALEKAKSYQSSMNMSPAAIRDQLTSEYGENFTKEEADYAIANLD